MRKVISLILILALSFQCLAKLGLITFYQLNKNYISKALCENKNKPNLHCEGKCFLKKSLELADKAEKKSTEIIKQVDFPVFIQPVPLQNAVLRMPFDNTFTERPLLYQYLAATDLFHPPLETA